MKALQAIVDNRLAAELRRQNDEKAIVGATIAELRKSLDEAAQDAAANVAPADQLGDITEKAIEDIFERVERRLGV